MPTHLDRSSLTATGLSLSLMATGHSCHPSPTASSEFLCLTPTGLPLTTSGHIEISNPNPLFGFAPKQTKGSSAWRTTNIVLQCKVWFGLVWWHINHCRLFDTKFVNSYIQSDPPKNRTHIFL